MANDLRISDRDGRKGDENRGSEIFCFFFSRLARLGLNGGACRSMKNRQRV